MRYLFILLTGFFVYSQTEVSGIIDEETTWTVSGSPYIVTGNVLIKNNTKLIIESSVVINFVEDNSIIVKGFLIINGTDSERVTINSDSAITIVFEDSNLNNSNIDYVDFISEVGNASIRVGDETEHNQNQIKNSGTLTINNSFFNNFNLETKGYSTTASIIVNDSEFKSSIVTGHYPRSETITFNRSNFIAFWSEIFLISFFLSKNVIPLG